MDRLAFLESMAPVIALLGVLAIGGWIFTTWLRVKNGYPLENSWGKAIYPKNDNEATARISIAVSTRVGTP